MHESSERQYSLYGLSLTSNVAFTHRLLPSEGAPDLTFQLQASHPPAPNSQAQRLYPPLAPHDLAGRTQLYALPEGHHLHFRDIAAFTTGPGRIIAYPLNAQYQPLIEIYFLGLVMSFYLEQLGIPALHASAAVVNDHAVAFLSTKNGGKSSLAAALMRTGHPLLTDDVLAVEQKAGVFLARPGYPQMRLWPEQARRFLGPEQKLAFVHPGYKKYRIPVGPDGFGAFCNQSQPLACLYLPERRDPKHSAQIEITAVSKAKAVIEVVRHSFVAPLVQAAGWQPQRLTLFAQLIQQTPVRHLIYPGGFEHLPAVADAILEDLAGL